MKLFGVHRLIQVSAILCLTAFATPSVQADQSNAMDAIESFDKAMLSVFRRGQDALTSQTRPVMVIARDVTILSENGQVSFPRGAPNYLIFKSTSHVLLGIIGAVTPWPEEDDADARWKKDFAAIAQEIDTLLPSLERLDVFVERKAGDAKGKRRSLGGSRQSQIEALFVALGKSENVGNPHGQGQFLAVFREG